MSRPPCENCNYARRNQQSAVTAEQYQAIVAEGLSGEQRAEIRRALE